jgi:hypothetical protein
LLYPPSPGGAPHATSGHAGAASRWATESAYYFLFVPFLFILLLILTILLGNLAVSNLVDQIIALLGQLPGVALALI